MKTYCPVRPANSAMSAETCSGVKATKSATTSKRRSTRGGPHRGGVPDVGCQQLNALRNSAENGVAPVEHGQLVTHGDGPSGGRGADHAGAPMNSTFGLYMHGRMTRRAPSAPSRRSRVPWAGARHSAFSR
jgi:hypothetical protein